MKRLYITVLFIALFIGESSLVLAQSEAYKTLKEGFVTPPDGARPKVYWWWLNGYVDNQRIIEEIAAMQEAGISGFDIFEIGVPASDTMVPAGPAFLSDASLESIKIAVQEAGRRNMEVGLNLASSWNAGGSWIKSKYAAKSLYSSKVELVEGQQGKVFIPFPEIPKVDARGNAKHIEYTEDGKPAYSEEVTIVAVPVNKNGEVDPESVIDVSEYFDAKSGELNWDKPEGEWEIHRYVCSNSGEQLKMPSTNSAGPIIDHFDADATTFHFNYIIEKLKSVLGDLEKSALKSMYLASYEATGFVWTPTLPAKFKEINGYDITPFLPALYNDKLFNEELTLKFKTDFRRTLSELMIDNFYKKAKEISNQNGLEINSESGGPGLPLHNVPVEPLKALGALDRPRGEFWINHNRLNDEGIDILRVVKEVSAASHIYQRGVVEEESFTTFQHWQEGPCDKKMVGDRAFCEGMNRVVVHGFSHNPVGTGTPGIVYHAGTHFNDKRVWWPKAKPFNDYLARISAVFQASKFYADVLYYYGDDIPNYGGHKNSRFTAGPGYDYEIVNTEILKQAKVDNGKIVLPNGAHFKMLVLEDSPCINPEILKKLQELVKNGATVVGKKPETVLSLNNFKTSKKQQNLLDKLWSKEEGVINQSSKSDFAKLLAQKNILPDLDYKDKALGLLDFIHYQKDEVDVYFVRNTTNNWVTRDCAFNVKAKSPELWDPESGEILPVSIFSNNAESTSLPVSLPPLGSILIVFSNKTQEHYQSIVGNNPDLPEMKFTQNGFVALEKGDFRLITEKGEINVYSQIKEQPVDGAWELFFPESWGAPHRAIFPELKSWTESTIDGIKYFSGTAKYVKTFQYDIHSVQQKGGKIYLDLGKIKKLGDVWLNDVHLGISWTEPHLFDITDILKAGDNKLIVEVSNTWTNRITGDALTGHKFTNSNINTTHIQGLNKIYVPWAEVPLQESGLIGPVKIIFTNEIH